MNLTEAARFPEVSAPTLRLAVVRREVEAERPLSAAPGALVCGYWRAASPLGWLPGIGLGRIEEFRTLPRRERPNGL